MNATAQRLTSSASRNQGQFNALIPARLDHKPRILMPTIHTRHRHGINRNGKHIVLRHAECAGMIKQDRKTGEWAYYEWIKDKDMPNGVRAVTLITSKAWADFMDSMNPEHFVTNDEWTRKVQLRLREPSALISAQHKQQRASIPLRI